MEAPSQKSIFRLKILPGVLLALASVLLFILFKKSPPENMPVAFHGNKFGSSLADLETSLQEHLERDREVIRETVSLLPEKWAGDSQRVVSGVRLYGARSSAVLSFKGRRLCAVHALAYASQKEIEAVIQAARTDFTRVKRMTPVGSEVPSFDISFSLQNTIEGYSNEITRGFILSLPEGDEAKARDKNSISPTLLISYLLSSCW